MEIGQRVKFQGEICKVISRTRSARECQGGYSYAILPETKKSLMDSIQYVTESQLIPIGNASSTHVAANGWALVVNND